MRISHPHTTTDEAPADGRELPGVERPKVERVNSVSVTTLNSTKKCPAVILE